MIEYDKFQKALKHLQAQFENYRTLDDELPELLQEAVVESVIQRFETCWDCLWKVLKRYLEEEIGLPDVPNGPNPILRRANENNLLPGTLENWMGYAKTRVSTSHDYSGEKAQDALALMGDFVDDAIGLYQTMSGESWE
ncbi:MAG: nucleotidyltransferase substrate binding protein [Candidatus Thiodiazotropha sp.]